MKSIAAGRAGAFLVAIFSLFASTVVHAQMDGPRGYMLGPEGVQAVILTGNYMSAN